MFFSVLYGNDLKITAEKIISKILIIIKDYYYIYTINR